ncbi:MAG: flavodoxin domain-containing protein [Candidatus Lokiarchaeota archaeon]|nr:flavodoxin domain-containing protein [Candidatus Lokiarchaeota archaeon]
MEKAKILIAYGTRYGATASTSEEIAKVLKSEGFEVKVVNLKKEKVKNITNFGLVIIGSGMKMEMWTSEAKAFLKKFSDDLKKKKVVIFVSSGGRALMEHKGEHDEIERITKKYLEDKASKYGLNPISMTMFGGVWDYNQISKIFRKFLEAEKENFIAAGIKETEPGVYDTRNWDEIRKWAKELANKI